MFLRLMCLLPLFVVASCAAPPLDTGASASPQPCEVRTVAVIPVALNEGVPTIAVTVEGQPALFVVDTGAEISTVTPSAMASLGLQQDSRRRTLLKGVGGSLRSQNALLTGLKVGGATMLDRSVAVGLLPGASRSVAGLLGADWLSDFDVEFDLPNGRMALHKAGGCSTDYVSWDKPKTSFTARFWRSNLMLMPVSLNGTPVRTILSSANDRSTLSRAGAARIGITPAEVARGAPGLASGVDGITEATQRVRLDKLQLGPTQYNSISVSIRKIESSSVEFLLGADWLRFNRVWLSYKNRQVVIKHATVPAEPG